MLARGLVTLFACVVALAVASGGAQAAPTVPKAPKIKTRIAKVQIDIRGYVETRLLHDTTSDCFPGERWIQANRYDFSTGGAVNVSLKRITGDGFDPIVTSPFSRRVGSARVGGRTSDYGETNFCTGEKQQNRPAPACSSTAGTTSVSLQEGVKPRGDDDELVPLTQTPLLLAIGRNGGGRDAPECVGPGAANVTGQDTDTAVVSTSAAPGVALIVPSGLRVMKVFGIRPGQRFRRSVVISGVCSGVALRTVSGSGGTPGPGALNADSDCFLTGKLTFTISPRPKRE